MVKVDPVATILLGAGLPSYKRKESRPKSVFGTTWEVIEVNKVVTYDLGGNAKTSEMASGIAESV